MTDLLRILPAFPTRTFGHVLPALECHDVSTAELLSLDSGEVARRAGLALPDVRRLCAAVAAALHADVGPTLVLGEEGGGNGEEDGVGKGNGNNIGGDGGGGQGLRLGPPPTAFISTLDAALDAALGGGFPAGYVSEITGESGAAKTQLLLTLLLAVQLPPPRGLGRPALYISTEAPLATPRLAQLLAEHPVLVEHRKRCRLRRVLGEEEDGGRDKDDDDELTDVALDNIVSASTPDLESQDHILTYQVPVEVERRNIGLVVLDSVAANYRAEYDAGTTSSSSTTTTARRRGPGSSSGGSMATRGNELVRLGAQLHDLARKHNLAVVVANQVSDRFASTAAIPPPQRPDTLVLSNNSNNTSVNGAPVHRPQGGGATTFILRSSTPYASPLPGLTQESPLASRSRPPTTLLLPQSSDPSTPLHYHHHHHHHHHHNENNNNNSPHLLFSTAPPDDDPPAPPALLLDHQQRWFTGWGDDPLPLALDSDTSEHHHPQQPPAEEKLKTPSLGLVWSTQVACRVALLKRPAHEGGPRRLRMRVDDGDDGDAEGVSMVGGGSGLGRGGSWRRWMKVVFAPHVPAARSGREVEFEVTGAGLKGVVGEGEKV